MYVILLSFPNFEDRIKREIRETTLHCKVTSVSLSVTSTVHLWGRHGIIFWRSAIWTVQNQLSKDCLQRKKKQTLDIRTCTYSGDTAIDLRVLYRGGSRGRVQGVRTPPPRMTCGRFLINTVQSLHSHTKSALWFGMYSQQFTLCYFLVKSPLLRICFWNFLRHQSVSGAPPPKKNPGSAPALWKWTMT